MNILSIDLDFLMPMLENVDCRNFNKDKISAKEYWENVKRQNKCEFKIDFIAKLFLENIFRLLNKFKNEIILLENHQDILNIINNEKVNIVNIDQHHDIYYSFEDKGAVSDETKKHLLESSWVYYLYYKEQLESYTWVTNSNARYNNWLLRYPFSFYIRDDMLYEDNYGYELFLEKNFSENYFDKIVFIKSPYYLPQTEEVLKIFDKITKYI